MQELSRSRALKILEEIDRRNVGKVDVLEDAFFEQRQFINDESSLVAALCTRRAGKSYGGAGLKMIDTALKYPGCTILYIALTRLSAENILCKDIMSVLNAKYRLNLDFNGSKLIYTFPNGSVIRLMGMNAGPQEAEKALGQKYKLVVIDEAGSFTQDLHKIVYDDLKPAVADEGGQIVLIGTPRNITRGLFFDVTTGKEKGWAVHKWTWRDNTFKLKNLLKEHDELIERNPRIVETPGYQQNWLGHWIIDTDALVYRYNDALSITSLPPEPLTYILGIDLGYEDDSAFTLVGYAHNSPTLYVIDTFKKSKMDITDVANKINEFKQKYNISKFVVDGAAKQSVEELRRRHHLPLQAAEKRGKYEFIEILNSELIQQRVKFLESGTTDLVDELRTLIWDRKQLKKVEHPSCPNHLCDSFLYAFRESFHYLGKPVAPKVTKYDSQYVEEFWDRKGEEITMKKSKDWWDE